MKTDVTFYSAGLRLAGHLYTPRDGSGSSYPAIVVGHPATGVKEQAAGLYASKLAERGFAALAFDAAYQGESGGQPRGMEDPSQRVEDIKAAVSFLSVQGGVDPERIGALGICASGAYVIPAVVADHRVKAVATISAVDIACQFRHGDDGTRDPQIIRDMLDAAAAARTAEARGEGVGMFQLLPETAEQARGISQHISEAWDYYRTERGRHARSAETFTWSSVDRIAAFDAFRFIDIIAPRPLLMIAGTKAVTSWMTSEAFSRARAPKEAFWVEGASHIDLYDKDEYVVPIISKLADFFGAHLTGPTVPGGQ